MKGRQIFSFRLYFAIFSLLLIPPSVARGTIKPCTQLKKVWDKAHFLWAQNVYTTTSQLRRQEQPESATTGLCSHSSRHWKVVENKEIILDDQISADELLHIQIASNQCSSLSVSFARDKTSLPRVVKINRLSFDLDLSNRGNGVLGIYCLKKKVPNQGPHLIYLYPTKESQLRKAPNYKLKSFISLVQELREEHHLAQIRPVPKNVHYLSAKLNFPLTHMHNRDKISKLGRELYKKGYQPIGENRANAKTEAEWFWQMWASPQHRRLLLEAKASHYSLVTNQTKSSKLVSFIVARQWINNSKTSNNKQSNDHRSKNL